MIEQASKVDAQPGLYGAKTINSMATTRNIALWFGSLLLSVSLFSLVYYVYGPGSFLFVFRMTMMLALPVACLYLPVVITLPDAEEGRIWTILASGTAFGPAALVLWGFILSLGGYPISHDDDIGPGFGASLILALIVGFLTSAFYVIALKVTHWLLGAAKTPQTGTEQRKGRDGQRHLPARRQDQ